jgi:hypothetical protein
MGQDSIKYSLMPITVVDPEKFQKASSVVLTMGAIWLGDPNSIKILEFPNRWPDAQQVVGQCTSLIMQSLGVNPAMMAMGGLGKKPTQAQISQEQQVALEGTADVVTILEASILNKLLRWFYELDYQFRTKDIRVRKFGTMGLQAEMQLVAPVGVDTHYTFKWYGTEGMKSAQQVQQMISLLNVMAQMPPQMLNGRKIDAGPVLEEAASVTFGTKIAPKVLIDQRHMISVDPKMEDEMLVMGFEATVSPLDNDIEHIRSHLQASQLTGDPTGMYKVHIEKHQQQLQAKQAEMQQAPPGAPSGGPRAGAQVQAPTGPQNPPGAIHPDQMEGAAMPRDRVSQ